MTYREPPLILVNRPFTQKFFSSGVPSSRSNHFANISNYTPLLSVFSTNIWPTSKQTSNVDGKENVKQNGVFRREGIQ